MICHTCDTAILFHYKVSHIALYLFNLVNFKFDSARMGTALVQHTLKLALRLIGFEGFGALANNAFAVMGFGTDFIDDMIFPVKMAVNSDSQILARWNLL